MFTLKIKVWKSLGKDVPGRVREGMVYWLDKIRLGKFRLVLLAT